MKIKIKLNKGPTRMALIGQEALIDDDVDKFVLVCLLFKYEGPNSKGIFKTKDFCEFDEEWHDNYEDTYLGYITE